eukprot:PhF_6_TR25534/c0_g1_i11/m.35782
MPAVTFLIIFLCTNVARFAGGSAGPTEERVSYSYSYAIGNESTFRAAVSNLSNSSSHVVFVFQSSMAILDTPAMENVNVSIVIRCIDDNVVLECEPTCFVARNLSNLTIQGCRMTRGMGIDTENVTNVHVYDSVMQGSAFDRLITVAFAARVEIVNVTVTNGRSNQIDGGCVYLTNVSSVLIYRSQFRSCTSKSDGGCMVVRGHTTNDIAIKSNLTIIDTNFIDCRAGFGSGGSILCVYLWDVEMDRVVVTNGQCMFNGGCLHFSEISNMFRASNVKVSDCRSSSVANQGGCWSLSVINWVYLTNISNRNCDVGESGGGMRIIWNSYVSLNSVTFEKCTVRNGTGGSIMAAILQELVLVNIVVDNVSSTDVGACSWLEQIPNVTMRNVVFKNCVGSGGGGVGIHYDNGMSLSMENVTIENVRGLQPIGSALYLHSGAVLTLRNVTVRNVTGGCISLMQTGSSIVYDGGMVEQCKGGSGLYIEDPPPVQEVRNIVIRGTPGYECVATKTKKGSPRDVLVTQPRYFRNITLEECHTNDLPRWQGDASFPNASLDIRDINFTVFPQTHPNTTKTLVNRTSKKELADSGPQRAANTFVQIVSFVAAIIAPSTGGVHTMSRNNVLVNTCGEYNPSELTEYIRTGVLLEDDSVLQLACISLALVIAFLVDVFFVLKTAWANKKSPFKRDIFQQSMAPGCSCRMFGMVCCSAASTSISLILAGDNKDVDAVFGKVIGVCALIGCIVTVSLLCYEVRRPKETLMVYRQLLSPPAKTPLWQFLFGCEGEWDNVSKVHDYYSKFGHMIAFYSEDKTWMTMCDYIVTFVVGCLSGVEVMQSKTDCIHAYSWILLVFILYGGVIAYVRPHHTPRDFYVAFTCLSLTTVSVLLQIIEVAVGLDESIAVECVAVSTGIMLCGMLWSSAVGLCPATHYSSASPSVSKLQESMLTPFGCAPSPVVREGTVEKEMEEVNPKFKVMSFIL